MTVTLYSHDKHVITNRASYCRYTMKVTKECPVTVQLSTSKHDVYFKLEVCSATYLYYFCNGFSGLVGSFYWPNTNSHCRCLTESSRSPQRRGGVMASFPSASYAPQPSWRRRGRRQVCGSTAVLRCVSLSHTRQLEMITKLQSSGMCL